MQIRSPYWVREAAVSVLGSHAMGIGSGVASSGRSFIEQISEHPAAGQTEACGCLSRVIGGNNKEGVGIGNR